MLLGSLPDLFFCIIPSRLLRRKPLGGLFFLKKFLAPGRSLRYNGKLLHKLPNGQYGAMFGAEDFIDYLNRWAFPESESRQIKALGCCGYELPEAYQHYPRYNF